MRKEEYNMTEKVSSSILIKIQKLLSLSNDKTATESEAKSAALAAQKLLAKYNLDIDTVNVANDEKEIVETKIASSEYKNYAWAPKLANVLSKNYCCKFWVITSGRDTIISLVFYGFKGHTEVAKSVFNYLFNVGNNLALAYCREYSKKYGHSRGVYNSYVMGFLAGIKAVLDEQCTALKIVIPEEVEEGYKEQHFAGTHKTIRMNINNDSNIYSKGFADGKAAFGNRKQLEGK